MYTLHVWPSKWNLQSLDPTCLAAVLYLQLTIPGKFRVAFCSNPDQSPNGQLPFLTHGHTAISTLPCIIAFVSSLAKSSTSGATDLDASLTSSQKAERVALYAHVESDVSDLVAHLFYGIDANFWGLTNPTLASDMSIPQRFYVPRRMRDAYKPRLEAAGLWSTPGAEEEKKGLSEEDKMKRKNMAVFTRAFEGKKILDKAKTALGVHANNLEGHQFFFGERPTSLDVYLAAHILLIADPPFPDAVLQIQLLESFPSLVEHARRIQASVARAPSFEHLTTSTPLLGSLVPRSFVSSRVSTPPDPADVRHKRLSLIYLAATLTALAITIYHTYSITIDVEADSEGDDEDSDAGESEEEELAAFTSEEEEE